MPTDRDMDIWTYTENVCAIIIWAMPITHNNIALAAIDIAVTQRHIYGRLARPKLFFSFFSHFFGFFLSRSAGWGRLTLANYDSIA